MTHFFKFVISVIICETAGIIGSLFTTPAIKSGWYTSLVKPSFTPPGYVIGIIWSILFLLMAVALYLVWLKNWEPKPIAQTRKIWNRYSQKLLVGSWQKANIILIFCLQLILNVLWSVIFFGLKFPGLAFFELLMLWFAILYTIINFSRVSKPAAYLLLPYLFWVAFAGYLNYSIWQINP